MFFSILHFKQKTWFQYNFLVKLEIYKFWLHYGPANIDKFSKGAVNTKRLGTPGPEALKTEIDCLSLGYQNRFWKCVAFFNLLKVKDRNSFWLKIKKICLIINNSKRLSGIDGGLI